MTSNSGGVDSNNNNNLVSEVSSDSPRPLKRSRKLTSTVWNEFEKLINSNSEVEEAKCRHCHTKLTGNSKSGTSHLRNHLGRCSKRKNVDIRQLLLTKNHNEGCVKNWSFDEKLSRRDLASAIILHEYPFSIVEHFGFRKFLNRLQPLFTIVSRTTIRNDILDIYKIEREKLYEVLDKNGSRVCLTTDMWTSCQTKGYLSLTAHFVDSSWVLQKRILRFVYVESPHTAEVFTNVLMNSLLEWNIDRKLCTITMDNASVNDLTSSNLITRLLLSGSEYLLLGGDIFHVRCAHILNIIVQYGLEEIRGAVHNIRDSVRYWTQSQGRMENFREVAKQLRFGSKSLILDVPTRWNSTYLMLKTALEFKEVFARLTQREKNYLCEPSIDEWERAQVICHCLKLFYDITEIFSTTKSPTANIYFPHVCVIKLALVEWSMSPHDFVVSMTEKMKSKVDKYWSICSLLLAIACILDPQYKMVFLEYFYEKLYGEDSPQKIEEVKLNITKLFEEYKDKMKSSEEALSVGSSVMESGSCSNSGMMGGLGHYGAIQSHLGGFDEFNNMRSTSVMRKSEFDRYLEEGTIVRSDIFNILDWWKMHASTYPILSVLARNILAIPVSTVASESAFSTGGRVVNSYRNRLLPETIEALMCSQDWLRNGLEYTNDSSSVRATISAIMVTNQEVVDKV